MRTVYVAVITLFFIAFIIDTDAFHLMPVIILAGNTVDTGAVQILYPIDFRIEFDCIAKCFCIRRIEKTEHNARGIFAEQRKVHASVRDDGTALHGSACKHTRSIHVRYFIIRQ